MRDKPQNFRSGVLRRHVRLRHEQPSFPPLAVMVITRQAPREVEAGQFNCCGIISGRKEQVLGAKVAVNNAHIVAMLHAVD